MPTLTHFDDCARLLKIPRDELIATLQENQRGTPLWHPLGFVSCTLSSGETWALKIHLWPKGERIAKVPNWPIHDHTYRIESRVLHGTVRNRVYNLQPGRSLELYQVGYQQKASVLSPTGILVNVSLAKSTSQPRDTQYVVELGQFHHSFVAKAAYAVSVVLKTEHRSKGPYVVGKPFDPGLQLPLYDRLQFPAEIFWRTVLEDPAGTTPTLGLEAGVVRIIDSQDDWSLAFATESQVLHRLLGNAFISAEHIGSTSVSKFEAKPIIDMMVAVPSMAIANDLIPVLSSVGYIYRPDGSLPDRVYFNKRQGFLDTHHISLTTENSQFWVEKLVFRDYLRAHPRIASRYRDLKRQLAAKFPRDRRAYTNGKETFVYSVLRRAQTEGFGYAHLLLRTTV